MILHAVLVFRQLRTTMIDPSLPGTSCGAESDPQEVIFAASILGAPEIERSSASEEETADLVKPIP